MIRTINAAISSIRELMNDDNRGAALSATYNQTRNRLKIVRDEESDQLKLVETEIRMKALEEETNYIENLNKEGQIDRETTYVTEEHIHRMRLAVTNRMQYRSLFIWTTIKRSVYKLLQLFIPKRSVLDGRE
ncbi:MULTISPECIES: hypothetical protein [Bacillaceae]|uniref:Uncharacterized protein n=1 Tax=Domibacillus aminovorans TaxID=29332 RepID=A0A177KP01_9BACI|nr:MULTISPECIES: hypothetical protein [Bacillaceae]OAH54301.1 hypothetical protein AWH48_06760 [Domibacillus aminovorans]